MRQTEVLRVCKQNVPVEGWLQGRQVSRAQGPQLGRTLANYLFLGRTLQFDAELEKKVRQLTAEQLVSTLRKFIDPAKISIVKAGDFAKAAAAPPAGK